MKLNIALLIGGYSKEYEVSVKSGHQIEMQLDASKYNVYKIVIEEEQWFYKYKDEFVLVDKNKFTIAIDGKTIYFDLVIPMIHGTPGEDGKLQAYFDMLKIPYTGSNSFASAITFNKYYCKSFVSALGVPIADSVILNRKEFNPNYIAERLGFPCFVKPNKNGSSVGISKVSKIEDLPIAINKAFQEDDEVVVEAFIEGRELTCGVFRNKDINIVLPITEIVSKREFFDFEAKYDATKADEITPAQVDEEMRSAIYTYTNLIYESLNCSGVVRVDYIVNNDNIYFLEVNSIPGMSENSIIPQQLRSYGFSIKQFLDILIEEALNKIR